MSAETISTLISTVGFPIAACGGLFWMLNTTLKELRASIDRNTEAVTKLCTSIDKEREENKYDNARN